MFQIGENARAEISRQMIYPVRKNGRLLFHLVYVRYTDENNRIRHDVISNLPQITLFLAGRNTYFSIWNQLFLSEKRIQDFLRQIANEVLRFKEAELFFYPDYLINEIRNFSLNDIFQYKYGIDVLPQQYFSAHENKWKFYSLSCRFILLNTYFSEYLREDIQEIPRSMFEKAMPLPSIVMCYIDKMQIGNRYFQITDEGLNYYFLTNEKAIPLLIFIS